MGTRSKGGTADSVVAHPKRVHGDGGEPVDRCELVGELHVEGGRGLWGSWHRRDGRAWGVPSWRVDRCEYEVWGNLAVGGVGIASDLLWEAAVRAKVWEACM